jgi:hypothetical protein
MSSHPALVIVAMISGGLYVATDSPIAYYLTVMVCAAVLVWSVVARDRRAS